MAQPGVDMTVSDTARAERMLWAHNRCEASGCHHKDCPGRVCFSEHGNFHLTADQFVLHHTIRRNKDRHSPFYEHRDDVEHLRLVWNGPTGLGAGGCHGVIHTNPDLARAHGLLAPRPVHALTLDPTGTYWTTSTGMVIT